MASTDSNAPVTPVKFPLHRISFGLARNPLETFRRIGKEADGSVARIGLGAFRPYLVTHPSHVRHILRDNAENYPRVGMMWKPMSRLVGRGIANEGPAWAFSRRTLQPAFAGRHIAAIYDEMAVTIGDAVSDLVKQGADQPIDSYESMTTIIHRAVNRVFFGNKISLRDAEDVGSAIRTATTSMTARLAMPWVPDWFPMPGDRKFWRSVAIVDQMVLPLVELARRDGAEGDDIVSMLIRARDEDGNGLTDRQIRDDLVAIFVAGSESTAVALSWMWTILDSHPEVAEKLYAEIDQTGEEWPPTRESLRSMTYTKMVLDELLRIYSVGWIIPRTAAKDDMIDGIRIKAGSTVIVSPYLTHRVEEVWPDPERFDPERFSKDKVAERTPQAYLAFGAGGHACIGQQFFVLEAQLILVALLRRCRPVLQPGTAAVRPRVALALIPDRPIKVTLAPRAPGAVR